ncbi:MAG: hypothetical protein H8K10_10675 [Nitrospira sp.]|nr:hypothetical protein [Nitrospira sp.]
MSAPTVSVRTQVRDLFLQALLNLKNWPTVREPSFDVSPKYLEAGECKTFPTYCVVATDERIESQTLEHMSCTLTLLVVIYAKDDTDPRARLDAALEDAYEALLGVKARQPDTMWKLDLEDVTTDEGARSSHPYAQAQLRWSVRHRRRTAV